VARVGVPKGTPRRLLAEAVRLEQQVERAAKGPVAVLWAALHRKAAFRMAQVPQANNGSIGRFLDLPERSRKPREEGITHVIDRGASVAAVEGLMETAGESVDIVKLGWGTALVSANLKPKLDCYAAHGVPVMLGGTLTEVAIRQGRLDGLVAWLKELDLHHVEVSDGTLALDSARKCEIISRLAKQFTVFSEVGSKDSRHIMAPYRWVEQIEAELAAGAHKVITEARESGTAGIFRPDGEVRTGLIDEIVHAVDPALLIFEAPRKEQQVWFLLQFGSECNLGNIAPRDVLSLETLRLGLRSETVERFGRDGRA
jgi:phosphosulfolactate synthase